MSLLQSAGVSVLYIEDDPAATLMVRAGLESVEEPGFVLTSAGTLTEALDLLEAEHFEVVLLDLGLPDSAGLGTLEAVRAAFPDVPIVVLTAHSYREVGIQALHSGADEFLEKDKFDGKLLTRLLVFAIERRRLLQEVRHHRRHVETAEVERSRLVEAVSQVDDLIIITDAQGTIQYVNPAFERITGYGTEEALGQLPRMLQSEVTPEAVYRELWDTLASGKAWRGCFVNKRRDGTLYRQESVISPIRGSGGAVEGYVGLGRDVTEERELEARLRQTQKLQALGQLASGVAHDFNNILAVILTVATVAKRDLGGENTGVASDIEEIIQAAKRAEGVVARLLGFSRQAAVRMRPVSLTSVVSGMTGMIRAALPSTIEFTTHLDESVPEVLAEPHAIEQILLNLVTNARDAMPCGGELRISVELATVDENFRKAHPKSRSGPHVCITVTDTGTGIDPDVVDDIYTPFFTTKPEGEGTGLGLSLVDGLMEQHAGAIHTYSEPGMGSVFKLYFPTLRERRRRVRRDVPIDSLETGKGEVILLVDDNAALRRAAARVLEHAGYEVRVAEDGVEGLELFHQAPDEIAAIVTDLVMPRMGGRELVSSLWDEGVDIPVVMTSGYLDVPQGEPHEASPRIAYLPKPWAVEDLLRCVRRVLEWAEEAKRA